MTRKLPGSWSATATSCVSAVVSSSVMGWTAAATAGLQLWDELLLLMAELLLRAELLLLCDGLLPTAAPEHGEYLAAGFTWLLGSLGC